MRNRIKTQMLGTPARLRDEIARAMRDELLSTICAYVARWVTVLVLGL